MSRPLCKKPFTVPDNKDYEKRAKTDFWLLIGAAAVIGIFILYLTSCSTPYKGIEKKPPLNNKDSSRLAARFKSTFPSPQPKTVPGKTVIKTVTKIDSSKVKSLQDKIDALIDENLFSKELLNAVPDFDSLKASIRKEIMKDCHPKETTVYQDRVDTIFQDSPQTIAEINLTRLEKDKLREDLIKTTAEKEIYKKQAKERLWIIIPLIAGLLFFGLVGLKKKFTKIPTA